MSHVEQWRLASTCDDCCCILIVFLVNALTLQCLLVVVFFLAVAFVVKV